MTAIRHISGKLDKKFLFQTQLNRLENKRGIISAQDVRDTIRVALPQAFGGKGDEWSPEHLFLGSISSCFFTTYLVFADKLQFDVSHFECQAIGQIEIVEGRYEFTTVNIYPKIYITDEASRQKAMTALEKAQRYCLISNSIKSKIIYHGEVLLDKHPLHKTAAEFSGL